MLRCFFCRFFFGTSIRILEKPASHIKLHDFPGSPNGLVDLHIIFNQCNDNVRIAHAKVDDILTGAAGFHFDFVYGRKTIRSKRSSLAKFVIILTR